MRAFSIIFLVIVLTVGAFAQSTSTAVTYNVGLPVSKAKNYLDKATFLGFGIELRNNFERNMSFGGSFSWNIFDQLIRDETIILPNAAVTGTQIRYINSFPLMVNAHYYFGDRRFEVTPYAGLNVGMYYIIQRLEIGVRALESSNWHFGVAPEGGFYIPLSRYNFLTMTARYNYAFDSGTALGGNENNFYAYWGFNIGLGWSYDL